MFVNHREALRSIQREAGRQFDFFISRNTETAGVWGEIESLASIALQQSKGLVLLINEREVSFDPIIIKHGEQAQQLANPLTGKTLQ